MIIIAEKINGSIRRCKGNSCRDEAFIRDLR
jgi:hypothetical protein